MRRKLIVLVLCIFILGAITVGARGYNAKPTLNFSGNTAICDVSVIDYGYIELTMTLSQGSNPVQQWSASGFSIVSINESCTVTRGMTYTLSVSGSVNGVPISGSVSQYCS